MTEIRFDELTLERVHFIAANNHENFALTLKAAAVDVDVNLTEIRFESELTLDRVASPVTVMLDESIV